MYSGSVARKQPLTCRSWFPTMCQVTVISGLSWQPHFGYHFRKVLRYRRL
jgi:hypothetical protein